MLSEIVGNKVEPTGKKKKRKEIENFSAWKSPQKLFNLTNLSNGPGN